MGEESVVRAPLSGVRFHQVHIGRNVIVMPGCRMMSAGKIYIEDNAQIAANVQLISNNHDLANRMVITCKPVHIGRRAWIGAGVTIGENSMVGAASVVTRSVDPDTIVAGNPARPLRKI